MADNKKIRKSRFLSRLLRDEAGNAIAIMAAAIIPVIGLVGGGVDVSRIYLVKAKLQSACDAGTLMGRRVMGSGSWTDDSNKAHTESLRLFDANFIGGSYGSSELQRSFSESSGNVNGSASAKIPMALMQVFGVGDRTINVTCNSELRIPSTDVMFVLDTTGSMNCNLNDSTCGNNGNVEASSAKIKGLRTAVRCFYEAMAKENITATSPADCGETVDPAGGTSADVRLRFGFVPYSVNVNVGKLLPLDYMADSWSYQSREAVFNTGSGGSGVKPQYGTESSPVETGTNSSTQGNTGWVDRPWGQNLQHPDGSYYAWAYYANSSSSCNSSNIADIPGSSNGSLNLTSQTPNPVVHPDNLITRTYESVNGTFTYEYRYKYYNWGWAKVCRLQRRQTNQSSATTTYETTQPVTWVPDVTFLRWDYKQTTFDVSGIKDTVNNAWRQNLTLPLGNDGSNTTINWSGCIEERQTARINDNDPSDNWDPIPAGANDMNIDLPADPLDSTTQWGPMLDEVYYQRQKYSSGWSYTTDTLSTSSNSNDEHYFNSSNNYIDRKTPYCPTEASLTKEWSASNFSNYLDSLDAIGNTYHDIGLLWGARLMSPTGIFQSITNDQPNIQRHLVFMTDGNTQSNETDISAYGMNWWDRRQNDGTSGPSSSWLISNIDARTQAVCKWARTNNITLWVISYGDVNASTTTNLKACVNNNDDRFFEASDTASLISDFKSIADSISALRLTS